MRPHRALFLTWFVSGGGALAGSILGNAFGGPGLIIGALAGGVAAAALSVIAATRFDWLPREGRTGAIIGGIVGFGVAAGLTVLNLHTPIVALLSPAFAGAGVLLGAGFSRKR